MPAHSPEIAVLQKKIAAHDVVRRKARHAKQHAEVTRQTKIIHDLHAKIAALRHAGGRHADGRHAAKGAGRHAGPHARRAGKSAPVGRDPFDAMTITPENAAAVYKHYADLYRTTPKRGILGDLLHHHWRRRANEARKIMRLVDKHGAGNVKAMRAKKRELRELARNQRRRGALARKHGKANEAADADQNADRYDEQIRVLDAAEKLPPEDIEATTLPAGRGGYRPPSPGGEAAASAKVEASVDEDGASVSASASADLELPWYRRYWIPLALAGALGVFVVASNKKGAKAMGLSRPLTVRPLTVSRMSFTAKRPRPADRPRAAK